MKHKKVRDYNEGRHVAAEVFKLILDAMYSLEKVNGDGGLWLPSKTFDALSRVVKKAHHATKVFEDGSIVCYEMRFNRTDDQYPWFRAMKRHNKIQVDIANKKMRCPDLPGAQGEWKDPRKLLGP